MYKIYDLEKGITRTYATEKEIAQAWFILNRRRGKVTFDDLNISGKDYVWKNEPTNDYFFIPDYGYIRKYVRNRYLRRYQVFDENGRSIDIRTWNIEWDNMSVPYNFAASVMYPDAKVRKPKGYEPAHGKFRQEPCGVGAKPTGPHASNVRVHRMMLSDAEEFDFGEYENLVTAKIKHRKLAPVDVWDCNERKYFGCCKPHASWKDNKCGAQWAKHKPDAKSHRRKRGAKYSQQMTSDTTKIA